MLSKAKHLARAARITNPIDASEVLCFAQHDVLF